MPTHDSLQHNNGMFGLDDQPLGKAVIKVIGVGGGGNNAVMHMVSKNIADIEFICANTDAQVIRDIDGATPFQLGATITNGLGAGANAERGRQAALEDKERILECFQGVNMLFITAGMGGGTGTGAAPVLAELARERGILTVAVVTKPFQFEGNKRKRVAMAGIEALQERVDSLIVIENDKLLTALGDDISMIEAFAAANDVLSNAVQGIADLITQKGNINVDFADVETVMRGTGLSMMGIGQASGENRAVRAAELALSSPLLQDMSMRNARGLLVNITASSDLAMREFNAVGSIMNDVASEDADVIMGTTVDPSLKDEVRVTVVATGIDNAASDQYEPVVVVSNPVVGQPRPPRTGAPHPQDNGRPVNPPPGGGRRPMNHGSPAPHGHPPSHPSPQGGNRPARPTAPPMRGDSHADARLDIPAFLRKQAD